MFGRAAAAPPPTAEQVAAARARTAEAERAQQTEKLITAGIAMIWAEAGVSSSAPIGRPRRGEPETRELAKALCGEWRQWLQAFAESGTLAEFWALPRIQERVAGWEPRGVIVLPAAAGEAAAGAAAAAPAQAGGAVGEAAAAPLVGGAQPLPPKDVPAAAGASDAGDGPRTYDGANPALMKVFCAWMHIWAKDGSHAGWNTSSMLVDKVWDVFHHAVPLSTAARWLKAERDRHDKGGGVRTQPDLAELIKSLKDGMPGTKLEGRVVEECLVVYEPQSVFGEHLIPELIKRCEELANIAGFGPELVGGLAAEISSKSLGAGDGADADIEWLPSIHRCRFCHSHQSVTHASPVFSHISQIKIPPALRSHTLKTR
jgi:hypothetical protein